jgi:Tfp pilus assembly protein PilF
METVTDRRPFSFTNHFNTACRYQQNGDIKTAELFFQKAADVCPEAWLGVACEAMNEGRLEEAIERLIQTHKATTKPKLRSICLNNIGTILSDKGHSADAAKYFIASIKECKNADAMANLSLSRKYCGRIAEARQLIESAIMRNPTSAQNKFTKSLMLLTDGDYEDGFKLYESRWKNDKTELTKLPVFRPEWNGENISGKTILIYAEQGAGDTIQMLRYAPLVKAIGAKVLIAPQKGLAPICESMGCFDAIHEDILDRIAKGNVPEYDLQAPSMSLPRIFKTALNTIPPAPYVPWAGRMDLPVSGRLRVGIVWAGSSSHAHDKWRSTSLESWTSLWSLPVTFYSLQVGPRSIDPILYDAPIIDLSSKLKTFGDTADAIAAMDLIVGVDTSVIHLAGAMGKATWLLNAFSPDWRWLYTRSDSPWYPSVTQFRQVQIGDWRWVIDNVRRELLNLC